MNSVSPEVSQLVIRGASGQGIQLLGFVLANLLVDSGYQVALSSNYSPLVRAGKSNVSLVFSKKKVVNPLVEKPELFFDLSEEKLIHKLTNGQTPRLAMNMVLLGLILKNLGLKPTTAQLKKHLPTKWQAANLAAIKIGQEL